MSEITAFDRLTANNLIENQIQINTLYDTTIAKEVIVKKGRTYHKKVLIKGDCSYYDKYKILSILDPNKFGQEFGQEKEYQSREKMEKMEKMEKELLKYSIRGVVFLLPKERSNKASKSQEKDNHVKRADNDFHCLASAYQWLDSLGKLINIKKDEFKLLKIDPIRTPSYIKLEIHTRYCQFLDETSPCSILFLDEEWKSLKKQLNEITQNCKLLLVAGFWGRKHLYSLVSIIANYLEDFQDRKPKAKQLNETTQNCKLLLIAGFWGRKHLDSLVSIIANYLEDFQDRKPKAMDLSDRPKEFFELYVTLRRISFHSKKKNNRLSNISSIDVNYFAEKLACRLTLAALRLYNNKRPESSSRPKHSELFNTHLPQIVEDLNNKEMASGLKIGEKELVTIKNNLRDCLFPEQEYYYPSSIF